MPSLWSQAGWQRISCSGGTSVTVNSITFTNDLENHSGITPLFILYSGSPTVTNNPIKICADGSTATYIKVNVSDTTRISFRILDENDQPINNIDKYGLLGTPYTFRGNTPIRNTWIESEYQGV